MRSLIDEELARLVADGITDDELAIAKGFLTGSYEMSLEDSGARMARIGGMLVTMGEVRSVEDQLARWEAVTHDDVRRVIARVYARGAAADGRARTRLPSLTWRSGSASTAQVGGWDRRVCRAVAIDPDLELVAAVDPNVRRDRDRRPAPTARIVTIGGELRAFADAACDVVVDFTVAAAARVTLPWLAMHGVHAVVGTTGLDDADVDAFRHAFGDGPAHCLIAPNFAISAVLMMRFAEMAAPFFESAEVIELHHDGKVDAPSGTAVRTAERMAAASSEWAADPTEREVYPGARGGLGPAGIRVHAVRMRGMVAHQEVILGTLGQTLTIRQDSFDRDSFMPGVILACKRIADHPGLTLGLDPLLGL